MALPASGQISFADVNTELGYASTSQISLNDSAVRSLAEVSSGQIAMTNLHGKSSFRYGWYNWYGTYLGGNGTTFTTRVSPTSGFASNYVLFAQSRTTASANVYFPRITYANYGTRVTPSDIYTELPAWWCNPSDNYAPLAGDPGLYRIQYTVQSGSCEGGYYYYSPKSYGFGTYLWYLYMGGSDPNGLPNSATGALEVSTYNGVGSSAQVLLQIQKRPSLASGWGTFTTVLTGTFILQCY